MSMPEQFMSLGAPSRGAERYVFDNFALGIDRSRDASPPRDGALYDLLNCHLSKGHTILRRHGFSVQRALSGIGLVSWGGKLHTFYSGTDPGSSSLVQTHKLVHPNGVAASLSKIHYAKPLNGYLYVVAEWSTGEVFHYYLDNGGPAAPTWAANTQHQYGDIVSPTVPNGFRYWATSVITAPAWRAGQSVVAGTTVVSPTTPNGFTYKATATSGPAGFTAFKSGSIEPQWPLAVGQTVVEDVEFAEVHHLKIKNLGTNDGNKFAWKPGTHIAAGETRIPNAWVGVHLGLHLRASYSGETTNNVNNTGDTEPAWTTNPGDTFQDGDVTWTVEQHTTITWTCQAGNETGTTEPVWPTSIGGAVTDGGITWRAISDYVGDTNCPQSKAAIIGAGQVWAVAADGNTVAHCGAGTPRAWRYDSGQWAPDTRYHLGDTIVDSRGNVQECIVPGISGDTEPLMGTVPTVTTVDGTVKWQWAGVAAPQAAGYLPTGMHSSGDTTATALALYRGNLVVFTGSGWQLWQIDPDPTQNALLDAQESAGCIFTRGADSIGTELYFPTLQGIRSFATVRETDSVQAGDAGVPIDPLVTPNLSASDTFTPIGIQIPFLGQYWLIVGQNVFVMTSYPAVQVQGWSRYTLPWSVLYAAILNGVLYLLASDGNLYYYDTTQYQDWNASTPVVFQTSIVWPYMVLGRHTIFQPEATAGFLKQVHGISVIASQQCMLQVGYDEANPANLTSAQTVGPDDRITGIVPIDVMALSLSPQISYAGNAPFEFSSMTVWYTVLPQVVG